MMAWRRRRKNYEHDFGRGWTAGYTEFRYGGKKKAVSMPRILMGTHRANVETCLLDHLKDWRSTPFENEGPMIASIRSALCIEGNSWQLSHNEASVLVAEGLRNLGAKRPTWSEGQHQITDSPDRCSWCVGPMPEDATRLQRFCTEICARNAIEHRGAKAQRHEDAVQRAAYRLIQRRAAPVKQCEECGKSYQSDRKDARFCSTRCVSRNQKGDTLLVEQSCPECGCVFMPSNRGQKHCSFTCHGLANQRAMRERLKEVTKACACCSATYTPKTDHSIYCSSRCGSIMAKRAYYYRQKEKATKVTEMPILTPAIFDSWFKQAA